MKLFFCFSAVSRSCIQISLARAPFIASFSCVSASHCIRVVDTTPSLCHTMPKFPVELRMSLFILASHTPVETFGMTEIFGG